MYMAGLDAATVPYVCPSRAIMSTSVDCDNAQASVTAMMTTFSNLGSPSQYADSVNATKAAFDQAWGWGISGPFLCTSVHTIGCQADQLTNQMLVDANDASVTGPSAGDPGIIASSPGEILQSALPAAAAGLGAGVIVVLAVAAVIFFKK